MTNLERARKMTAKEFFETFGTWCCPPGENVYELCFDEDGELLGDKHDCRKCWLKWLNQEEDK